MAYKGKRVRPHRRMSDDQMANLALVMAWFSFALSLAVCVYTIASAKEPDPTPVPRTTITRQVDDPPVTEYAVCTEPVPELVSMGEFKITHYCPCSKCCGEWADGITYTGTQATAGRTIAVDPDVIPLGSTVVIDGQEYIAEDIGGAIHGSRLDIFMDSHQAALEAGVKYAEVFIYE